MDTAGIPFPSASAYDREPIAAAVVRSGLDRGMHSLDRAAAGGRAAMGHMGRVPGAHCVLELPAVLGMKFDGASS